MQTHQGDAWKQPLTLPWLSHDEHTANMLLGVNAATLEENTLQVIVILVTLYRIFTVLLRSHLKYNNNPSVDSSKLKTFMYKAINSCGSRQL